MSIVALMQDAADKKDENTTTVKGRRRSLKGQDVRRVDAPEPTASPVAAVATELTRYIPTEAIGVYTAVLPFLVKDGQPLTGQDFTTRWILAAAVALLAVFYAVGVYRKELAKRNQAFHWPPKRTITVLVAFAAWVMVIPGSPFQQFSWYSPALGGAIGFFAVGVLGAISLWFGEVES